jgi:O-acetyl-ADP-ribose deacetylase
MDIVLVRGDITGQDVDVVVNAANPSLLGGGGVDGAIHRRGGPSILAECRSLRAERYRDGLPAGQAVATTAGRLPARWVVHTVGPVYSLREDRSGVLASCYTESLRVAESLGARSVAFPAVSAGAYGWPAQDAARIAVEAVRGVVAGSAVAGSAVASSAVAGDEAVYRVQEVRFVLFGEEMLATFERAYRS